MNCWMVIPGRGMVMIEHLMSLYVECIECISLYNQGRLNFPQDNSSVQDQKHV